MSTPAATVHPRTAASMRPRARCEQTPIRPATSGAVPLTAGPVCADAALRDRAARASSPLAAPSWKAFRMYAGSHPSLAELKAVGVAGMVRAHRGVRTALAVGLGSLLILLVALLAYWWLAPATADADSPYATAEVSAPESTPSRAWKQGAIPSLYQADGQWGGEPFGQGTVGTAGAAPTALAMAAIALTGDTTLTPAEFAHWGTAHDLTATGADTIQMFLAGAGDDHGLILEPLVVDAHAWRRAVVSHLPVLVITQPGTFAPVASVIVLDDIDRDSRLVIHDPTSASRSAKSWAFDDVTGAAAAAFTVRLA